MTYEAFPLQWPQHVPRSKRRTQSNFARRSLAAARDFLVHEVRLLGGRGLVLSTNVELRRDGLPYSGRRQPDDPGAVAYFELKGKRIAMPCDRWNRVDANVYAIAKTIEAQRGIARWGVLSTEQAFEGFAALPAPGADWRAVFEQVAGRVPYSAGDVRELHRGVMARRHPDKPNGMSTAEAARLNEARDAALREIGGASC